MVQPLLCPVHKACLRRQPERLRQHTTGPPGGKTGGLLFLAEIMPFSQCR